jgi:hypothetical protein
MKKVIISSEPDKKAIKVKNMDHLIHSYSYIGFEERKHGERYFIVTSGPAMGFAVNPEGTFALKNEQMEFYKEGYFVFETDEELYNWMQYKGE